jgi:hypothetical protein
VSLTLIDRFHPRLRREQQTAIEEGNLRLHDELALLEGEQLRPLAWLSLQMLLIGAVFFIALTIVSILARGHGLHINAGFWSIILWLLINIIAYIIVLPLHEAIHGLAFAFWGGKPYFGTKLPLALYCGAKNQLFHRDQYLVVGLAPLVVITLAGIVFTLLAPGAASYILFATIGNVSGAAGDLMVALRLLRQSPHVLIEDTETGYRSWEITSNAVK